MKICIYGDQVLVQLLGVDCKGCCEVCIVCVLVLKISQIVGCYFIEVGVGFVVFDDSCLSFDILILFDQIMGVWMGFVVVVELIQCLICCIKVVGKIVEVLGDNMGIGMVVNIVLCIYEILYIWLQVVE